MKAVLGILALLGAILALGSLVLDLVYPFYWSYGVSSIGFGILLIVGLCARRAT